MVQEPFEPRKVRDFGEIINDTFVFIFRTWKPLLKTYVVICGFFVLAGFLTSLLQQFRMIRGIRTGGGTNALGMVSNIYGFETIVAWLFSLMTYTSIILTSLAFIHLYKEKENEVPTVEEVWTYVKFYFFKFMGSAALLFCLLFIGFIFCVLPGLYLWPIISLVFPIMLMENTTLGFAFSKAFTLIKGNWWSTFGILFIMMILIIAVSLLFYLPASLIGMGSFFVGINKMTTLNLIIQGLIGHISMVFFIVPNIALALTYYSLSEQKDGISLIDRIKKFGSSESSEQVVTPEEY